DGYSLLRPDVATAKHIHGTAQSFAGERLSDQRSRQAHDGSLRRYIIFRIRTVGKNGHRIALANRHYLWPQRLDFSPAFMTKLSRLQRILEPRPAFPGRQVGATHAAAP